MTDIIERAEALNLGNAWCNRNEKASLVPELVGELKATRLLLEANQRHLSEFIADFCALRDALPREQVEKILSRETA